MKTNKTDKTNKSDKPVKHECGICGETHGDCFICETICFADGSAERALFIGFNAALGIQLRTRVNPQEVVQLMLGKLCKPHQLLWSELSIRTTSRIQAGKA